MSISGSSWLKFGLFTVGLGQSFVFVLVGVLAGAGSALSTLSGFTEQRVSDEIADEKVRRAVLREE